MWKRKENNGNWPIFIPNFFLQSQTRESQISLRYRSHLIDFVVRYEHVYQSYPENNSLHLHQPSKNTLKNFRNERFEFEIGLLRILETNDSNVPDRFEKISETKISETIISGFNYSCCWFWVDEFILGTEDRRKLKRRKKRYYNFFVFLGNLIFVVVAVSILEEEEDETN